MTGTEVFAATRDVFLDFHVRITEPDNLYLVAVFDVHLKLFAFAGRTHHPVEWRGLLFLLSHPRNLRCGHAG